MPLLKTVGSLSLVASLAKGSYSTGNFAVVPSLDYYPAAMDQSAFTGEPTLTKNKNSFTSTSFGSVGFTMNQLSIDGQIVEEMNLYVVSSNQTRWYRLSNSNITYQQPNTGSSYVIRVFAHVYGDNLYVACRMKQVGSTKNYYNVLAFKYLITDTSITQVWGQNIYVGEGLNATGVTPNIASYDSVNNRFLIEFGACATINGSTFGIPTQVRIDGTTGVIAGSAGFNSTLSYPSWGTLTNASVGWNLSTDFRTNGTTTYKHTWAPTISAGSVYSLLPNSDGYIYFLYSSGIAKWNPFTNTVSVMSLTFSSLYSNTKSDWRIAVDDANIYVIVPALVNQGSYCGIFKFTKTFTFVKSMKISSNGDLSGIPYRHISIVGTRLYCTGDNVLMSFNKDLTIVSPGQFDVTSPITGFVTTYTLTSTITPTIGLPTQGVSSATSSLPSGSSASIVDSNPTISLTQLQVAIKAT
jgi:hypothetical protein